VDTFSSLKWDAAGLVTVVVQDERSGEIRMVAHANADALRETLTTGFAHFYSRSRGALWKKGETSGHTIEVREIWTDCDGDALVYVAEPAGPSCHTERTTCFFRRVTEEGVTDDATAHARPALSALFAELEARRSAPGTSSYTRKLLDGGAPAINAKIVEEAGEVVRAIEREAGDRVISEAADVLYHLFVGLLWRDLSLRDVQGELLRRSGVSGLLEKARRTAPTGGSSP
jgi:phosphoribosyl-ATP pyrophosphohydrolase/phosphoribosyl-AMP cyclohydrolase